MTMSFDQAWTFTDTIPGSFTRLNGEVLYKLALQVQPGEVIVEVGVDQGRSASLLLAASEITGAQVVLVDSWESVLIENKKKVEVLTARFPLPQPRIIYGNSVQAAPLVTREIALLHIDANHYGDNPSQDCAAWLPKLKSGGVACFHDAGSTFPAVDQAVANHTAGWQDLGLWEGLAVRRKP